MFSEKIYTLFRILLFFLSLIICFFSLNRLALVFTVLLLSLIILIRFRTNSYLLILFGIVFYINMSAMFSEILNLFVSLGEETLSWQSDIRASEYWLDGVKSMILMLSTLNLFLPNSILNLSNSNYIFSGRNNVFVFYFGYFLIWIIFIFFSYSSSSGEGYVSDTNTLYEYCLVLCPIIWVYSNKSFKQKAFLFIFVIAYCFKSYQHGDRSSMIPMALFLFLIFLGSKNIRIRHIVVLSFLGILVSNVVSISRIYSFTDLHTFISNYMFKYGSSFLSSDTVSQSYYTSVVTQLTSNDIGGGSQFFFDFIGSIFFGGGFKHGNVSNIVVQHYTNKYGGFYYSWPYFWFGYTGVFVFSAILAFIIGIVFKKNTHYCNVLKLVIVVFSFRWYLYTCFDFFRACLFVTTICYFIFYIMDYLTKSISREEYKIVYYNLPMYIYYDYKYKSNRGVF